MAQLPGIPWDQRPDYVALTQRIDPAGIVTAYNPPRPGVSATDVTSFVFGQATMTVDSWPEVMYYLHPTAEWHVFRAAPKPPQKVDANGQPMVERFPRQGQQPRPLLDFRILPDTICSQEELWWIELWRRMDPRIRWQDILMRVELPNRTVDSDRKLQNSTNNLINRHEHQRLIMLSWHTTGANRTRRNDIRNMVLRLVGAARPPLPPNSNSTRGLTPGLINPRLGNVAGNSIPFPSLMGRIRAHGRPPVRTAVAAPSSVQQDKKPGKRPRDETSEDDTDNSYDGTKSSEGTPLSEVSARPPATEVHKPGTRHGPAQKSRKDVSVRGTGPGVRKKKIRRRSPTESHDNSEAGPEHQEDQREQTNPPVGPFIREGDPGFEAAFQASNRQRRQRQVARQPRPAWHGPRNPAYLGPPRPAYLGPSSQYVPESPPTRRTPQSDVSDSEILGDSEESTLRTPAERSSAAPDPRVPAPSRDLANSPTPPLRHPRKNPMTGLPFEAWNRRPEALSGYSDTPVQRGGSSTGSRVPLSTRAQTPEDNHTRTRGTRDPNPGLPTDPADWGPQGYYYRSPGGNYYHVNGVEIQTPVTNPRRSSSSGMGSTQTRSNNGRTQRVSLPPQPSRHAHSTNQHPNPINDATDRSDSPPNHLVRRLSEERRRHDDASQVEMRRHARALQRIEMEGGRSDFVPGFIERDDEGERREKQGSTDDDDDDE